MCTLAPLLLLVVTLPLQAQEPAMDSAVPTAQGYAPEPPPPDAPQVYARTGMDRSTMVSVTVLPLRSETQLREALSNSETDLRRSEARLSRLSQVRSSADAVRPQHRAELREIEAKIRQADKEKRKADKATLEGGEESTGAAAAVGRPDPADRRCRARYGKGGMLSRPCETTGARLRAPGVAEAGGTGRQCAKHSRQRFKSSDPAAGAANAGSAEETAAAGTSISRGPGRPRRQATRSLSVLLVAG